MVTAKAANKTSPKAAPTKKAEPVETEAVEEEEVFGVAQVAELIKDRTGKIVKTRDLRILLRKLARDGRLDREIVAGNRARWEFEGPEDARVETILEAFENGELEQDKKAKLDALKARKAAQKAEAKAAEENAEVTEEVDEDEALED